MAQIQSHDDGGGKKVRSKKNSTAVDMAPLVDLGFLLITFFMFAATSIKPNVMNLNMPPKIPKDVVPPTEVKTKNSITVIVAKDNKLFWYQEEAKNLNAGNLNETDYTALRDVITRAAAGAPDKDKFTVIIKPMDDASYDNLVNVLDEMEITKSTRYGIVQIVPTEQKAYDEKVGK
ncbi:Biopolymer transport protein ExbD [Chishuiella changwenlii]|jgi:biopolymer transport protein ExbD|uniref:Biopolymer transport ExbD protein n=1 Tax=Chishuiella changwenlii TaxID=1434701 RepID=A0A1M6WH39_9FLAO|nr:biopolymer transporter ExbD [Chishuiella changwenlii]GGF04860.1 biopolymer transport ExbD protein [Chishuiella changwenlii]SHK92969.1 Biopolymer transport protein ExbD [Chishuiella changwenlii]